MSTAIGHGLADPKRRGKPVSSANKGRRVWIPGATWEPDERTSSAKPGSKGNPVNIPEPEGWTGRSCLLFWLRCAGSNLRGVAGATSQKECPTGGNASTTFGTLAVTLGRDLFSS